jgi:hypothetical protein
MVTVFADMFAERMDICTSYVSKVADKGRRNVIIVKLAWHCYSAPFGSNLSLLLLIQVSLGGLLASLSVQFVQDQCKKFALEGFRDLD